RYPPRSMRQGAPRVSFGLPVRNGERFLRRALESLGRQDYSDFEVVIADNQSSDATPDIVREFASEDARFRYIRNETDIGQIENFNRVLELSRGPFFRWIGSDDWVEPSYTGRCVAALEARSDAVGVTTLWQLVDDEGGVRSREYTGPRVDSQRRLVRIARALRLFQADRLFFDPIYSMLRRSSLEQTGLLPIDRWTDRMLAFELCLLGPFTHVHERLASRREAREPVSTRVPRFHQTFHGSKGPPMWTLYARLAGIIRHWPMPPAEKAAALSLVGAFSIRSGALRTRSRVTGAIERRLTPHASRTPDD
ncbi:glycosyltransferase family 2 protein, partial [bacterium]|nr:glycosyltransferase family 2 protein [bacterium]